MPDPVPEGQEATLTLRRLRGNFLEPLTVQVRTWEPNREAVDGSNPSEQLHTLTFPALTMTDRFVDYVVQTQTITVATIDDTEFEFYDFLEVELEESVGRDSGVQRHPKRRDRTRRSHAPAGHAHRADGRREPRPGESDLGRPG